MRRKKQMKAQKTILLPVQRLRLARERRLGELPYFLHFMTGVDYNNSSTEGNKADSLVAVNEFT
jgi:hypothetical protein